MSPCGRRRVLSTSQRGNPPDSYRLTGNPARAVRLWAACEKIRQRIGGGAPVEVMQVSDPCPAAALAIGEEAVKRAWAEGWAMSPEQAVRYATREPAAGRTRIEP